MPKRISILVVTVCALCLRPMAASPGEDDRLRRARVHHTDAPNLARALAGEGFDVTRGSVQPDSLEIITSLRGVERLRQRGVVPEIIEVGRPFREIQAERAQLRGEPLPSGYPDLAAVYAQMASCQTAFPGICRMVDLTQTYGTPPTVEGRHLFAVKISDNVGVEEDEPAALIVSAHHALEIVTPVIALHAMNQLTSRYNNDAAIRSIVDANEIWIAPVWNPDGYNYIFTVDNWWRKNRRAFADGIGVDLNRNYPIGWNSSCSGSTNVNDQTYKGPAPGSEAETLTMMAFAHDRHFAKALDYHSFGRGVIYGYDCLIHPFQSWLGQEAANLSAAHGYSGGSAAESQGYQLQYQLAVNSGYFFLVEAATTFQPAYTDAVAEATMVFAGVRFALQRAIPLSGHVTNSVSGAPLDARVEVLGREFSNCEYNRSRGPFGRYHLFLPSGSVTLRFCAPGYVSQQRTVTVSAITTTVLDVQLSSGMDTTCSATITADCNGNFLDDSCEMATSASPDCNGSGVPDSCELSGPNEDCNANSIPDECEIAAGDGSDCNANGVLDECDIDAGTSEDCAGEGLPDECEPDCNENGMADSCDLQAGSSSDCNGNSIPDDCDIAQGSSTDLNANGVPDDCEDCNRNGVPDGLDISAGTSLDCTGNSIPDECEPDCNGNQQADSCDVAAGSSPDCNGNSRPDECDLDAAAKGLHLPAPEISVPAGFKATIFAAGLAEPNELAISEGGPFGTFIYASTLGYVNRGPIVRVGTAGNGEAFSGTIFSPRALVLAPVGNFGELMYVAGPNGLYAVDVMGIVSPFGAPFSGNGLAFGFQDDLYATRFPNSVMRVNSAGGATPFAELNPTARLAGLHYSDAFPDATARLLAIDWIGGVIYQIDGAGNVAPFSREPQSIPYSIARARGGPFGAGFFFTRTVSGSNYDGLLYQLDGNGNSSLFASGFVGFAAGLAFGEGGAFGYDLFVAESDNGRIIRISPLYSEDCNSNGVPDECDVAQGTTPDCNANAAPDACDISSGAAADCNSNQIPDSCDVQQGTIPDCNGNIIPDPCELESGAVSDCNANGIPDDCDGLRPMAPSHLLPSVARNRFVSFVPPAAGDATALRVTFSGLPGGYGVMNGRVMWVGPPRAVSEIAGVVEPSPEQPQFTAASLQCSPHYADWNALGAVHVYHPYLVPGGTYTVQAITRACDPAVEPAYSPPLTSVNSRWGDVGGPFQTGSWSGPDNEVNITEDVLAVLEKFGNRPGAPAKSRADVEPAVLDLQVNITDVTRALDAFRGLAYPFPPPAWPCP